MSWGEGGRSNDSTPPESLLLLLLLLRLLCTESLLACDPFTVLLVGR